MRKLIAILILIPLLPIGLALQTEQIDDFSAKESLEDMKIDNLEVFLVSKNYIEKLNANNSWTRKPEGYLSSDFHVNDEHIALGTRIGGRNLELRDRKTGNLIHEKNLGNYVDSVQLYRINDSSLFAGGTLNTLEFYNETGEKISSFSGGGYSWHPYSFYSNNRIAVGAGGKPFNGNKAVSNFVDLNGTVLWKSQPKNNILKTENSSDGVIISGKSSIDLYSQSGGRNWSINTDKVLSHPQVISNKFVYTTEGRLVFRHTKTGQISSSSGEKNVRNIQLIPSKKLIVARQNNNLSFFDYGGDKVYSREYPGLTVGPRTGDYTGDNESEIGVAVDNDIKILDIINEVNTSQGLENTVFTGTDRELFKAVALDQSVSVSNINSVPGGMNKTVVDSDNLGNLNDEFDVSREKYYAGSRKKLVYVSALASKKDATVTFNQEDADRDFSNYSLKEIQNLFIEKFEPNHVVAADLESEKGILASYMAVKQGSMPLHTEDNYNAVILENRIENIFDRIGENRKTIFQGKYISLLDAPAKLKSDPVEKGFFDDPEDGNTYTTDLDYGNLNKDRFLEAGIGRYPENTTTASLLFHRSINRELGDEALVASEYLHSTWPVILSTGGGGLRYGSSLESVFKKEGHDTTHLVEYRANPVKFLLSLTPVEITAFLGEVDDIGEIVEKFVSENAANALESFLVIVKALTYTEQLMEMYFEFQWNTFEFNLGKRFGKNGRAWYRYTE
ncbi:MAG: hypothetical protein BRC29_00735 [Nanohaloarchaea archaeon SW_7_43_1]|nr:MAG: hypothetical protein BRC29_00735 [Nanohaloarchaea archaeon SW_7_43_1]